MSTPIKNSQDLQGLCRTAIDRAGIMGLRHGGRTFSTAAKDETRLELLASVRSGEGTPVELEVDLRAFQQQDGVANRNFTRFKKSILRKLAKSFEGVPLLKDHDSGSLEARAGTILSSKAVPIDGGMAFEMTARVTAPFAVEAVLAGNLDRFSIGWDFPGLDTLECSACKCEVFSGDCSHFPGDKLTDKKGEDAGRAEFVFTVAEGVEVSAVSVPAVKGTGLDQIRSALSVAALSRLEKQRESAEEKNMKEISKALGLNSDSEESTIIAGIGALLARAESAEAGLAAEREEILEIRVQLASAATEIAKLTELENVRTVDSWVTEFALKFPVERDEAGERVTSGLETQIRVLAAGDIGAARAMRSVMPDQRPSVGEVPQVLRDVPAVSASPSALTSVGQSEVGRHQRSQLKMSDEDFAKFNSVDGTHTAHLRGGN